MTIILIDLTKIGRNKMSIQTECGIMVGLHYTDAIEYFSKVEIDTLLDDCEIDYASPWYDSEMYKWIIGKWVSFQPSSNTADLVKAIEKAREDLSEILDCEFKIYCTLDVS